jgi:hypothetical protein
MHIISVLLSFYSIFLVSFSNFRVRIGFSGTELQLHLRETWVRLMTALHKPITS